MMSIWKYIMTGVLVCGLLIATEHIAKTSTNDEIDDGDGGSILHGITPGDSGFNFNGPQDSNLPESAPPGKDFQPSGTWDAPYEPEPLESPRAEKALQDVHFDYDKFDLKASEVMTLEGNAQWLKDNPDVHIVIEGHCDERGSLEYNLLLGEKRAEAAKDFLMALGVEATRMKTISYGYVKPADPGHNEEAWAKNRRVHFVIQL